MSHSWDKERERESSFNKEVSHFRMTASLNKHLFLEEFVCGLKVERSHVLCSVCLF